MFVPGKLFRPSPMFAGKARAYPSEASNPPALPTNMRLGWKSLPVTNTRAYYEIPQITAVKIFIVQAPGYLLIGKFTFKLKLFS